MLKNSKFKIFALIVTIAPLIYGCPGMKDMVKDADQVDYTVDPSPLEVHGDSIAITVKGKFPEKYFLEEAIMTATPVLEYDGGKEEFGSVKVKGQEVQEVEGAQINHKKGGDFTYKAAIPYKEGMEQAELKLNSVVTMQGEDEEKEMPTIKLADGTIITATRVNYKEISSEAPHNYDPDAITRGKATVNFPINKYYISRKEKSDKDVKDLDKFVNEYVRFDRVDIHAQASPDGPQDLNKRLANDRAKSTFNFISDKMVDAGVKKASDKSFFKITTTAEDWAGLTKLVKESDLDKKDEILSVLNSDAGPDEKEKKIDEITDGKNNMGSGPLVKELLPKLRKSDVTVNAYEGKFSDKEIQTYVTENPDTLTANEFLYAIQNKSSRQERMKLYKKFIDYFPDDFRGYNNLAAMYIAKGEWDNAKKQLNKAKKKESGSAHVLNNLAVLDMKKGNYKDAETKLKKAQKKDGEAVKKSLGTLALKRGDYKEARNQFGDACANNAALVKVLTDNAEAAAKTLDCSDYGETAQGHYLRAIIAARNNNYSTVKENLKKAIKQNPDYKEEAKKDLEFQEYKEKSDFKSIVE